MTKPLRRILLAALLLGPAGCDVEYLTHIAFGQLGVLTSIVPVSQALADPNLSDLERARLALTQDVRRFGIDQVGLRGTDSYTVFHYNGQEPAAWIVVGSARDSLTPFLWDYPIIGQYSTRGFFDFAYAERVARDLEAQGYDALLGRAAGFSTLNVFPDPIRQSNLQMDEIELAELILHEMLHQTVFKLNDGNFNESMATFVGRTAAQSYFDLTYGPDSEPARAARIRYADKLVIDQYVTSMYNHMNDYYTQAAAAGIPRETIIAERDAQFEAVRLRYVTDFEPLLMDPDLWVVLRDTPVNNARLLASIVYQGNLSDYRAVYEKVGGDFRGLLAVLQEAANQEDSRAYLRAYVEN